MRWRAYRSALCTVAFVEFSLWIETSRIMWTRNIRRRERRRRLKERSVHEILIEMATGGKGGRRCDPRQTALVSTGLHRDSTRTPPNRRATKTAIVFHQGSQKASFPRYKPGMGRDFATGPPQDAIPREAAFSEELRVVKSALERIIRNQVRVFPCAHTLVLGRSCCCSPWSPRSTSTRSSDRRRSSSGRRSASCPCRSRQRWAMPERKE